MDDADCQGALGFLGRSLPAWARRRVVAIEPGQTRPFDEAEWTDALVVVEQGEIVLECIRGGLTTFRGGDVLWLEGVPLRSLHNRGLGTAVIVALSRRATNTAPTNRGPDPQRHVDPQAEAE